jgi:mRNA-degrading endonuclease toxin of MazEF toxin-antitoxin module
MSATVVHYCKGAVVLVQFAGLAVDGTPSKRKPAVIVSSDSVFSGLGEVLLVPLRSATKTNVVEKDTAVQVNMDSDAGKKAGLRVDSIIDCTVIATIPKRMLVAKIGQFPQETIDDIDECLKRNLGLDGGPDSGAGIVRKPYPFSGDSGAALEEPDPYENVG